MLTIQTISTEIKSRLNTPGVKAKPKTLAAFKSLRNRIAQCKSLNSVEAMLAKQFPSTSPRTAIEVYGDALHIRVQKQLKKQLAK